MEPWDGPAAICATDGRWVVAGKDRNGLRPLRVAFTEDGLVIMGSEAGMTGVAEARITRKAHISPGRMIAIDLAEGKLYDEDEIIDQLSERHPYTKWLGNMVALDETIGPGSEPRAYSREELVRRQVAAGLTLEDMELILAPMIEEGKEAIGSMGDDAPLAVLSEKYRPLSHFFRQNFSQVTNPPIDPLRESRVMSLKTRFKNLGNILAQDETQTDVYVMDSPVLTNGSYRRILDFIGAKNIAHIDCTMPISGGGSAAGGRPARGAGPHPHRGRGRRPTRMRHHRPDRRGLRPRTGRHADDPGHGRRARPPGRQGPALLRVDHRAFGGMSGHALFRRAGRRAAPRRSTPTWRRKASRTAWSGVWSANCRCVMSRVNFKTAIEAGLLKILSKMGIAVIASYRGGYNFEAMGLSRALVAEFFPGMPSRISGIGLAGLEKKAVEIHRRAWGESAVTLPMGGFYKARRTGEAHAFEARLIHTLQQACDTGAYDVFKRYSEGMRGSAPVQLRELLDWRSDRAAIELDEVESVNEIRKRFVTPGMSLGALGPEAHGALNIAMNRIGAKSVSGEGGEDRARYKPLPNGVRQPFCFHRLQNFGFLKVRAQR